MKITEYKKSLKLPIKQATLCFLVKNNKILLGMKKRGFGEGLWNGFGGKPNVAEAIVDTAIREVTEEIGVTPKNIEKVATLSFYFPHKPEWNQEVKVFLSKSWKGSPTETRK